MKRQELIQNIINIKRDLGLTNKRYNSRGFTVYPNQLEQLQQKYDSVFVQEFINTVEKVQSYSTTKILQGMAKHFKAVGWTYRLQIPVELLMHDTDNGQIKLEDNYCFDFEVGDKKVTKVLGSKFYRVFATMNKTVRNPTDGTTYRDALAHSIKSPALKKKVKIITYNGVIMKGVQFYINLDIFATQSLDDNNDAIQLMQDLATQFNSKGLFKKRVVLVKDKLLSIDHDNVFCNLEARISRSHFNQSNMTSFNPEKEYFATPLY